MKPLYLALGIVLIVAGIAMPQLQGLFATAIVDTSAPNIQYAYFYTPSITAPDISKTATLTKDINTPGLLTPGTSGDVAVAMWESNPKTASVSVTGGAYSSGSKAMTVEPMSSSMARAWTSWSVPSTMGVTYTFTFTATDVAGNTGTATFYGRTEGVDGYFTINGQKITSQSDTVYLNTKTVTIKFYATQGGAMITTAHAAVTNSAGQPVNLRTGLPNDLAESVTDKEWTLTGAFPADGKYNVEGQVWVSGVKLVKMSLFIDTGFTAVDEIFMLRAALIVIGAGVAVYGIRTEEED